MPFAAAVRAAEGDAKLLEISVVHLCSTLQGQLRLIHQQWCPLIQTALAQERTEGGNSGAATAAKVA